MLPSVEEDEDEDEDEDDKKGNKKEVEVEAGVGASEEVDMSNVKYRLESIPSVDAVDNTVKVHDVGELREGSLGDEERSRGRSCGEVGLEERDTGKTGKRGEGAEVNVEAEATAACNNFSSLKFTEEPEIVHKTDLNSAHQEKYKSDENVMRYDYLKCLERDEHDPILGDITTSFDSTTSHLIQSSSDPIIEDSNETRCTHRRQVELGERTENKNEQMSGDVNRDRDRFRDEDGNGDGDGNRHGVELKTVLEGEGGDEDGRDGSDGSGRVSVNGSGETRNKTFDEDEDEDEDEDYHGDSDGEDEDEDEVDEYLTASSSPLHLSPLFNITEAVDVTRGAVVCLSYQLSTSSVLTQY